MQADQVSQTNAASATWLSFREHALVPRVLCLKNRRGLSTIECTWARRALRMKSSSNRKYAKEVIEPFFFSLWFYTHCCWCFCGQPSGIDTQLDNQAEIEKKKSISTHVFHFIFIFFSYRAFTSYFILQSATKSLYETVIALKLLWISNGFKKLVMIWVQRL